MASPSLKLGESGGELVERMELRRVSGTDCQKKGHSQLEDQILDAVLR